MAIVDWLVPVVGMLTTAGIIWSVVWYKMKKAEFARPDADFRKLAEMAMENQRTLTKEIQGLNDAVQEIQQLLAKV